MPTIEMKLKPWQAPNFANLEMPARPRGEGVHELPSIPVSELSGDALRSLAHQWLTDLYKKAGKSPDWAFHAPPKGALQ